jgi:hypothetical protein
MTASLGDSFNPGEVLIAFVAAGVIQTAFVIVLVVAGRTTGEVKAKIEELPPEIPIAVKPVMDDLPLLKLGGKKRAKLPDMWKKQAPIPVEQMEEETSAPSDKAKDDPAAIPTNPLTEDAAAPASDADTPKETEEEVDGAAAPDADSTASGEGHKDGVKEGTETDPLKARALGQYRGKLIGWFNSKFHVPSGQIPCEELKKLNASVTATVSPDGTVTGFSVGKPSGNAVFDGRVQAAMQSAVGQQVPPPPPLYPDMLPPSVSLSFLGSGQKCQ